MLNNFGGGTPVSLLDAAEITTTANGTGKDLTAYCNEALCILSSAAASSGDTLDVTLETCSTVDGTYAALNDIAGDPIAFTQIDGATATVEAKIVNLSKNAGFVRAVATIAGNGSESIIASCVIYCMPKVRV